MAKTLKFSTVALLSVLLLWACGGKSGPKDVAEKFLAAIAAHDYQGAAKFATKEAQESLKMMASMGGMAGNSETSKIEVGDVKEDGDKATVAYTEDGKAKSLEMVKEDGEWKANWSKGGGVVENALEGTVKDALEGAGEALKTAGAALDSAAGEANEEAAGH
jgi:hypothetical protein